MMTLEEYFSEKKLPFNATFGEAIVFHRNAINMTQAELAEKMGVSVGSIVHYETDRNKRPRFNTVRKFEQALGVNLNQYYVLSTFSIDLDIRCENGVLPEEFTTLVAERENLTVSTLHVPDANFDCFLFTSTEKKDVEDVIALLNTDSDQEAYLKECVMAPRTV